MIDYKKTYEDAFKVPGYNDDPGADKYQFVLKTCDESVKGLKNYSGLKSAADIGCGKGYMLQHLRKKFPHLVLYGLDIKNFLNEDINDKVNFIEIDITGDRKELNLDIGMEPYSMLFTTTRFFDFVTCLDVLEHIEKDKLDDIVNFISAIAPLAYITVGNHPDVINGVELHPTKEKLPYWQGLMEKYFTIVRMENREDIWYSFELQSKYHLGELA